MAKKKRPREHIIADISVNHIERYVFLCGYSVERVEREAIKQFARYRDDVLRQIQDVIRHNA
jgi:hypothetical protein